MIWMQEHIVVHIEIGYTGVGGFVRLLSGPEAFLRRRARNR